MTGIFGTSNFAERAQDSEVQEDSEVQVCSEV